MIFLLYQSIKYLNCKDHCMLNIKIFMKNKNHLNLLITDSLDKLPRSINESIVDSFKSPKKD